MTNNDTYMVPEWPGFSRLVKLVAIILALLLLLFWLLGYGPGGRNCEATPVAAATEQCNTAEKSTDSAAALTAGGAAAVAGSAAVNGANDADILPAYNYVEGELAQRIYFASASSEVDLADMAKLAPVLGYLNSNDDSVAVLSGYHDPSGDYNFNQALARNRATAVRDYLVSQGADSARLLLEKPVQTEGTGDAAEARRVEVRVANLAD